MRRPALPGYTAQASLDRQTRSCPGFRLARGLTGEDSTIVPQLMRTFKSCGNGWCCFLSIDFETGANEAVCLPGYRV
jgi:hypothetical protein